MTEMELDRLLRQVGEEEERDAPERPSRRTLECLPFHRLDVRLLKDLNGAERAHIRACPYCASVLLQQDITMGQLFCALSSAPILRDSHGPRILIMTDEPASAAGATAALSSCGFGRVAVCAAVSELSCAAESCRPEVLLMDFTPDVTIEVLVHLRRELESVYFVLWVRSISPELAYQAMELGVRGILRKTLPADVLGKCLSEVSRGSLWFDKSLTASILSSNFVTLTERESQIVNLVTQGLKNREIACTLAISESTVKVYLSRLISKIGVRDRFELAVYGLRNLQSAPGIAGALRPRVESLVANAGPPCPWGRQR